MNDARGYRTVVIGAASLQGKELVTVLHEDPLHFRAIELMAPPAITGPDGPTGARLVDLDEEPAVEHGWDPAALADAEVIFLCGSPAAAQAALPAALASKALLVDLTGAGYRPVGAAEGAHTRTPRLLVVSHPAATALARLVALAAAAGHIEQIAAVAFEPASERGLAGLQELEKQTLHLLGVRPLPTEVFDAQVAFVLRAGLGADARPSLAEVRARIEREYQIELSALAPPQPPAAIELLQAPLFHGTVLSLFLRYGAPAPTALAPALRHEEVSLAAPDEGYPEMAAAAGGASILLGPPRPDAAVAGGWWLFAVCDNLRRVAVRAVDSALAQLREHAPPLQ